MINLGATVIHNEVGNVLSFRKTYSQYFFFTANCCVEIRLTLRWKQVLKNIPKFLGFKLFSCSNFLLYYSLLRLTLLLYLSRQVLYILQSSPLLRFLAFRRT